MSMRCLSCMNLISEDAVFCPYCGYRVGTPAAEPVYMQPGTRLRDRYTVGKALGSGGFGVTYAGFDDVLDMPVAIKEYFPREFSTRIPGQSQVTVYEDGRRAAYEAGLQKFVDEAVRLARFQNEPGIVRIFDTFRENDTAYLVMEYLYGETLVSYLNRVGPLPEDQAVQMILPVIQSLRAVHQEGLLHRDIAPDNIFLTMDGQVKLIDFGAARYTAGAASMTVIVKPGFSPEEQYRSLNDQGPYTDVYALAATLYRMITGVNPPDALERRAAIEKKKRDPLKAPHELQKNISQVRENAILNAMNVRIEDRTPDMVSFLQELMAEKPAKLRGSGIRRTNLFGMPLWLKILVPAVLVAAVVLSVLLATGVISFSRFGKDPNIPEGAVTVPEVEGLEKDDAVRKVERADLKPRPDGTQESRYVAAGKIVYQSPKGGTYLEEGGEVLLTVSCGKGVVKPKNGIATVPYVTWDTLEDALEKLEEAGLGTPTVEEKPDEYIREGNIISQSIEYDEEVAEGTPITLVVSSGPPEETVPGKTEPAGPVPETETQPEYVPETEGPAEPATKPEPLSPSLNPAAPETDEPDEPASEAPSQEETTPDDNPSEGNEKEGYYPPDIDADDLRFLSVRPDVVGEPDEAILYKVEIGYNVVSFDQAIIYLGANIRDEDSFTLLNEQVVERGFGTVTLTMEITAPEDWELYAYINISEYGHGDSWSPILADIYKIGSGELGGEENEGSGRLDYTELPVDYYANIVSIDGRECILSLDIPNLQESYRVNLPGFKDGSLEYRFGIYFSDGKTEYLVNTAHFHDGDAENMLLYKMETYVTGGTGEEDGDYYEDAGIGVREDQNQILWHFMAPKNFDPSKLEITKAVVIIPADTVDYAPEFHVNGRTVTFSMEFPGLQPSYMVNLPETDENGVEYGWGIEFSDGKNLYQVMIMHFKNNEDTHEMTLMEMQTDLWKDHDDHSFHSELNFKPEIDGDRITWTFTAPDDMDVSSIVIEEIQVYMPGHHIM